MKSRGQVEHLIRHPQLAAIGTAAKIIDESGNSSNGSNGPRMIQHNTVPELLRFELTADCIFVHSSIMFNCAIIDKHLIKYDPKFSPMEDYALWVELFADPRFKVSNLTEALQNYREVTGSMIRRDQARNERVLKTIRKVALRKFLGRGRENGPRSWRQVYIRECLFLFKSAWKYSLVVFLSELFNLYRKHRSISYR